MSFFIVSILPFLIVIALILWKKEPILPLILGIFIVSWIISKFNPITGFIAISSSFIRIFSNYHNIFILLTFIEILCLYYLFNTGNNYNPLINSQSFKKLNKGTMEYIFTGILIVLAFEEFLAAFIPSVLLKPFIRKKNISKERFSLLVNSIPPVLYTLIPLTMIVPIVIPIVGNTLSGIGIDYPPLKIYIHSLPFQFFNIFMIIFFISVIILKKDLQLYKTKKISINNSANSLSIAQAQRFTKYDTAGTLRQSVYSTGISLIIILIGIPAVSILYIIKYYNNKIIVTDSKGFDTILLSIIFGSIIYYILYNLVTTKKDENEGSISKSILKRTGIYSSSVAVIIYIFLSLTMASALLTLNVSNNIVKIMISEKTPVELLPMLFFIISVIISFITGSRKITLISLIPIALKTISNHHSDPLIVDTYTFSTLGAVISGSTFGVINSPLSPIFIISSAVGEININTHFLHQIQYSGIIFIVSIVAGYLLTFLSLNPIISIAFGIIILSTLFLLKKFFIPRK